MVDENVQESGQSAQQSESAPQQSVPQSTPTRKEFPTLEQLKADGEINEEVEETEKKSEDSKEINHESRERKTYEEMIKELTDEEKKQESEDGEEKPKDDKKEYVQIKHNGEFKNLTKEEAIDYAQKGFDYTQKTQALSKRTKELEDREAKFNDEFDKRYESLEKTLIDNKEKVHQRDMLLYALQSLKEEDPDTWDIVDQYYQNVEKIQNTPLNRAMKHEIDILRKELNEQKAMFKKAADAEKGFYIRTGYENELNKIKSDLLPKFTQLGLRVDLDRVRQIWESEGAEKQGLTLTQALYQVYGNDLAKLYESKQKVNGVKNIAGNLPGIGSLRGANAPQSERKGLKHLGRSWNEITDALIRQGGNID